MAQILKPVRELEGCRPNRLPLEELLAGAQPVVLRGLVSDWGLTRAGLRSDRDALEYIRSYYKGAAISASFGGPEIGGRLFYKEDFSGLNFANRLTRLDLRIAKRLALSDRMRLQANVNIYNVFNGSASSVLNSNYGPLWMQPSLLQDGRMVQFSGSLTF